MQQHYLFALLALTFAIPAQADELLLFEGDPAAAVSAVTADAKIPAWSLDPQPTRALVERLGGARAHLLGDGVSTPNCPHPSSNLELLAALSEGEAALVKQQWPEAVTMLERGLAAVPCLGEPAEASTITQLHYLRGVVALEVDGTEAARQSFARALQYRPTLRWNDDYPPKGKPLLEAARADQHEVAIIEVLGPVDTLWIDGQARSPTGGKIALTPGIHLVQLPGSPTLTWLARVDAALPARLVAPSALSSLPVSQLPNDPLLSAVLDEAAGAKVAWLRTADATWRYDGAWTRLPAAPPDLGAQRASRASAFVSGGLVAAGLGMVGTAFCVTQANRFRAHPDWELQTEDQAWRTAAWRPLAVGAGASATVGAIGLGATAWGLHLSYKPKPEPNKNTPPASMVTPSPSGSGAS